MGETKASGNPGRDPSDGVARRGELLPELTLFSADGRPVRLSNYRGRLNLVGLLAGRADDTNVLRLLDELAERYPEFSAEDAEVIVILSADCALQGPLEKRVRRWPFVVLMDREGQAEHRFNAVDASGQLIPVVFIADRYGEIYAQFCTRGQEGFPKTDEILQWLFFINSQCPECGVPEWPE